MTLALPALALARATASAPVSVTLDLRDTAIHTTIITPAAVAHVRTTSQRSPTWIEVTDTFTNPTAAVVGVRVAHTLAADPHTAALGGRTDATLTDVYNPWNPTLFVPTSTTSGVGLVAVDDVFRNQLRLSRNAVTRTASLRTDLLCLAPGATYAMVWHVYRTDTADYWDFLDTLRRDRRANDVTLRGALIWFRPDDILARSPESLRDALAAQNVAVASSSGGWVDPQRQDSPPRIGFGTEVLAEPFAAYRDRIRAAVAKLHAARPGLRVLLYFDAQRDSTPDAATRFADSLLYSEPHRPERSDFGGRFTLSWSMVPTIGNTFGDALAPVVRAMRALGADGLYWDEMDAVEYSMPRLTTAQWDSHTCRLDADGNVLAKLGLANLLSDPLKARLAADTFVLGNSPPTTRRMQERPDLRMVEAQHNDAWGAFAHLTTPLGYLGSWLDWPRVRAKIDEGVLVAGGSLDRPVPFIARLFPFTPEHLRPGVLRGRERIVTTRSGVYGWPDAGRAPRVYRYDAQGGEHPADWSIERRDGRLSVRVELGPDEAAVIETGADDGARPVPPGAPAARG